MCRFKKMRHRGFNSNVALRCWNAACGIRTKGIMRYFAYALRSVFSIYEMLCYGSWSLEISGTGFACCRSAIKSTFLDRFISGCREPLSVYSFTSCVSFLDLEGRWNPNCRWGFEAMGQHFQGDVHRCGQFWEPVPVGFECRHQTNTDWRSVHHCKLGFCQRNMCLQRWDKRKRNPYTKHRFFRFIQY